MSSKPAALGGTPVRSELLPFHRPFIGEEEKREVLDTLSSGWITTGPKTKRFEDEFARYVGARHAVAVNSCTAGLHLALLTAGVGLGDEVVTSPLTFAASANVVCMVGARPIFADIDPRTFNLDPDAVELLITAKTRAIIAVDYAGLPCDMRRLRALARRHGLALVEDAAHSVGASQGGEKVGTLADLTAFSFYATKNITTGEGGMVTTAREDVAERLRVLSLHGLSRDAWARDAEGGSPLYEVVELGYKYNMTDIQAAVGLHQLGRIETFQHARQRIARRYEQAFAGRPWATLQSTPPDCVHVRHLFPLVLDFPQIGIDRPRFLQFMLGENVQPSVHFQACHLHPYYRRTFDTRRGQCPVGERVGDRVVTLPLFPAMTDRDADDVVAAVEKIVSYAQETGGVA